MKKLIAVFIAAMMIAVSLPSCGGVSMYSATSFDFFDTVTELVGYTRDSYRFAQVRGEVRKLLSEYHMYFDIYNTYGDRVNLAAINATEGMSDRSFSVSREIYELLSLGKEVYGMTGGKVNIAMGSVLSLWHECRTAEGEKRLPDTVALEEARAHCSIDGYTLTESP